MTLYNLRSLAPDTYMICKFSDDFEVEATYTLTAKGFSYTCDCPANNRAVVTKPCRHKLMMPTLLPAVDTDRFYDHDTGKFCTPLGDLLRPEAKELEGREAMEDASMAFIKSELDRQDVDEAPGSSPNMTATEVNESMAKAYEPVQKAFEAMIEPMLDRMLEIAAKAEAPAPAPSAPTTTIIRRR